MEFSPGQARPYTCNFCQKGFSNAQALGGHMNIHRRDRAKLRQSLEENLLSLDMSMKNTSDHDEPQPWEEKILFQLDSGDDQQKSTSNHKKPCTLPSMDDHALQRGKAIIGTSELPQLPLLVGMPNSINEIREGVVLDSIEEKKTDVDLELRLGPQEAPTKSTREFF